ncbi:MAG: RNA polymerase factor sigma-54 [Bacteroidales bacterium]
MLKQQLQQKLLQKLSPQQIQLMKLLQVPALLLDQRIKQEIEENPALEEGEELTEEAELETEDYEEESVMETGEESESDDYESTAEDEFDLNDYVDDDETPDYQLTANNVSPDDESKEMPYVAGASSQEALMTQLGMRDLSDRDYLIASHIIGNIDESGYLQRDIHSLVDDLAFNHNIKSDFTEVVGLLRLIQEFDPAGVGARDLQECLLLQIKRREPKTKAVEHAKLILDKNFNDFTKKHYEKIKKKHGLTENELKEAINEILNLNPKPGNSLQDSGKGAQYVVPDFIITHNNGELELTLNSYNSPDLRINRTYAEMFKEMAKSKGKGDKRQKEALQFVKQKLDNAKWFIDAIKQRQQTLMMTMQAIMEMQREYFLTGDETKLKPMILKDIAEMVNLDISTISRVASSKYVQTPFGTFLLKDFFSESLQTDTGEEVSTREVKKILQDCIEGEDKKKPITDEELAGILKEKGYNIARRTVAKYREQLDIPVARLRKEL